MEHVWLPSLLSPNYEVLKDSPSSLVRVSPMPDGKYLWQFRRVVSYAATIEQAREYVEAGAEFFETHRRNPYAT